MKLALNLLPNDCLFLDRDGVINERIVGDYVKQWAEFKFIDGVFEALQLLKPLFATIVIVTNQQGIGKGLYSVDDLHNIHNKMLKELEIRNIKIDAVFFAPQLKSENSNMRKPAIGMANMAKQIFPSINLENSVMVGDSISDMQFGRNANMKTVFISNNINELLNNKHLIDFSFESILDFAKKLDSIIDIKKIN